MRECTWYQQSLVLMEAPFYPVRCLLRCSRFPTRRGRSARPCTPRHRTRHPREWTHFGNVPLGGKVVLRRPGANDEPGIRFHWQTDDAFARLCAASCCVELTTRRQQNPGGHCSALFRSVFGPSASPRSVCPGCETQRNGVWPRDTVGMRPQSAPNPRGALATASDRCALRRW